MANQSHGHPPLVAISSALLSAHLIRLLSLPFRHVVVCETMNTRGVETDSEYSWTSGGECHISHISRIASGGYGEVHKVITLIVMAV